MEQKYLGITPYDEEGLFEFAGRTDETWALYDRINRNDYTVYYATSGEGKSSLIRAGLLPVLRRRDYFPIYVVFNDLELNNPELIGQVLLSRINSVLNNEEYKDKVFYEQSSWSKLRFNEDQTDRLKNNLWWKLRNYCFKKGDVELKPLFIFDQFEEVFTKANYIWTDEFFRWLEEISTDYVPESLKDIVGTLGIEVPTQKNFKALFSFRTEYLGDLDYWCVQKHFIPSLQENRMCLKPLTTKGAEEVININREVLGPYTDKIILGCSEPNINIRNENQPCVYALILSVVCQTLSSVPDDERIAILDNLTKNQDKAIDDVLLKFYIKKLKDVGLNYVKDEQIVAKIEDALVNENGKRNRRETNEKDIVELNKWFDRLSQKENGLLKIIGSKRMDNEVVTTIEFPHDRLCKAIDSARKERRGKKAWQLNRRTEWMQFGIMAGIVTIIAFLWNSMMEEIWLVMYNLNTFDFSSIDNICDSLDKLTKSDAEGITTLILMLLLLIVIPVQVYSVSNRSRKWAICALVFSLIGSITIIWGFFLYNDLNISNKFIPFINLLTLIISFVFSIIFAYRLKSSKEDRNIGEDDSISVWPLLGGIFLLFSYVFYELLTRLTFGTNEPYESTPCIVIIPTIFSLLLWSILQMKVKNRRNKTYKTILYWGLFVLSLSAIAIINYIPSYLNIKQKYGFPIICLLLLICIVFSSLFYWKTESRSKYYDLTNSKRLLAIVSLNFVVILTFILNLGYNPIFISPSTVCHVANWRSVIACDKDSLGKPAYFGIIDPLSGKELIPYCIEITEEYDMLLRKGCYPFDNGQFSVKSNVSFKQCPFEGIYNYDYSLIYDVNTRSITGTFATGPVFEDYLHYNDQSKISNNSTLKDSIGFYAVQLFKDIRKGNLKYLLKGELYDATQLPSLNTLDSLQYLAFKQDLEDLNDSIRFTKFSSDKRATKDVLEDKNLVNMYKELTRCMLVSLIRDRVGHKDISALFTLARIYPHAFFSGLEGMRFSLSFNMSADQTHVKKVAIYSQDLNEKRLFAWYNLFDAICILNNIFNANNYRSNILLEKTKELKNNLEKFMNNTNRAIDIVNNEIRTSNDLSYKELMNVFLNSLNKKKLLLDSLLSSYEDINIADNRLNMIMDNTTKSLFKLINDDYNAVYNNAFESTIQNLILVSLVRGHDIQQDTIALFQYRKDKNADYNNIISYAQRVASEYNDIDSLMDILSQQEQEELFGILLTDTIKRREILVKLRDIFKVQKK